MSLPSKKAKLFWAAVVVLTPALIYASNLTIPNSFTAGTPIQSAQMNANFNAVQTAVNSKQDVTILTCPPGQAITAIANGSATCSALPAFNTGCANGVVGQTWSSSNGQMVGCDCVGTGCLTPVRNAQLLCSPGWHVCSLTEWNTYRSTILSTTNRWMAAIVSCNGCNGDVLQNATDPCTLSAASCAGAYPTFVGPAEVDLACTGWPTGINNGNVGRTGNYGCTGSGCVNTGGAAKANCLTDPGTATSSTGTTINVVGTMCCQ